MEDWPFISLLLILTTQLLTRLRSRLVRAIRFLLVRQETTLVFCETEGFAAAPFSPKYFNN